jgi:hypothetical protein
MGFETSTLAVLLVGIVGRMSSLAASVSSLYPPLSPSIPLYPPLPSIPLYPPLTPPPPSYPPSPPPPPQNATWVTTPEQYSTEMRTVGHASCVALSKSGAFLAPFMITSTLSNVSVGTILCGVNLVGALAALQLVETSGVEMDTLDEIDDTNETSYAYETNDGDVEGEVLNELRRVDREL